MDKRILVGILVVGSLSLAYATGRSQSKVEFDARMKELGTHNFERLSYGLQQKLLMMGGKVKEEEKLSGEVLGNRAEAIGKTLDKPEGYDAAYYLALGDYETRTASEDSTARIQAAAAQALVELQVIQIEQNRKIISLLERMNKP